MFNSRETVRNVNQKIRHLNQHLQTIKTIKMSLAETLHDGGGGGIFPFILRAHKRHRE